MRDPVRKHKKKLTHFEENHIEDLKTLATQLYKQIDDPDMALKMDNRCKQIALVRLEECVMWAVKAVTGG